MPFVPQATTVIDDFNRADGDVAAGAGAPIWDTVGWGGSASANLVIVSNQLASAAGDRSRKTLVTLPADMEFRVDMPAVGASGTAPGWFFCLQNGELSTWSGYFMYYDQGNGFTLYKRVAGTITQIGYVNLAVSGGAVAAGEAIDIYRVGSAIKVRRYIAGAWVDTPILDVVDSDIQATGTLAIEIDGTAWRFDNLRGNAAVAEGSGTPISASESATVGEGSGVSFAGRDNTSVRRIG